MELKVLEILKGRLKELESASKIVKMDNSQEKYKLPILNIIRAIAELEALQNRSCEGCNYSYYDFIDCIALCNNKDNEQEYLHDSKMQITSDFCCNKWESKC